MTSSPMMLPDPGRDRVEHLLKRCALRDEALHLGQALEQALPLDDLFGLRLARLPRQPLGFEQAKHAQGEGEHASHPAQKASILGGEGFGPGPWPR